MAALSACHDGSSTGAGPDAGAVVAVATEAAPPEDAAAPQDAAPDASLRDMIAHAITLLEQVGDIVEANIADCAAMADRVEAYRNEHLAAIQRTDEIYHSDHAEEFEKLKPVFHDRYHAAWRRIRPGIVKCKRNPKMRRVLADIWGDDVDAGF